MQALTSFQASITIPCLDDKKISVNVEKGQNIKDLVFHLTQLYAIPPYLTNSVYSSILSVMSTLQQQPKQKKKISKESFLEAYQSNTLQYNNKSEEDIFPRAYHTLVHCPVAHIFDTLLELEQGYALAIQELQDNSHQELQAIKSRQAQEIDAATSTTSNSPPSNNMTTVFTRHVEEIEVFQATWQSNLLQTQQNQRQDYRAFVIELYREYQSRLASLTEDGKKLDGKELVSAAAARQWDSPTEENEGAIRYILEMGFKRSEAESALVLSNHHVENAITLLLEQRDKVDRYLSEKQNRRSFSHLSKQSKPETRRPEKPKSWNPISFLQQQKHAMENTNLSSVRKLGGWLGRAMENLGIEESGRQSLWRLPQLVESFSIMMGTGQIKSAHNLRLVTEDEDPGSDPSLFRAETATKLYTSHLTGSIVPVDLQLLNSNGGWRLYSKTAKPVFEYCRQSTEFHFADLDHQLSLIEQDLKGHVLTEGSFFITKHSNLPTTQVIFHLLVDSSAVANQDISTRHPLMIGLRNILKMTSHYDISSLSIPLLILPDRFGPSEDHLNWLLRRGEVVLKCVKGFLIENARHSKRQSEEGRSSEIGLSNVEFVLPIQPHVYNHSNEETPITQEVEHLFQQFRTLLVNLFRTS